MFKHLKGTQSVEILAKGKLACFQFEKYVVKGEKCSNMKCVEMRIFEFEVF